MAALKLSKTRKLVFKLAYAVRYNILTENFIVLEPQNMPIDELLYFGNVCLLWQFLGSEILKCTVWIYIYNT